MISNRLSVRSPIREIAPSLCLPPLECWRGVIPTQAAKSRMGERSRRRGESQERGCGDRADAGDRHQPARDLVRARPAHDLLVERGDLAVEQRQLSTGCIT